MNSPKEDKTPSHTPTSEVFVKIINEISNLGNNSDKRPLEDFHKPISEVHLLNIGKVTASFIHLESAIRNSILSRYPIFPKKYLMSLRIEQLVKIYREFENQDTIDFVNKARDFRNKVVHSLYQEEDSSVGKLKKFEEIFLKAFPDDKKNTENLEHLGASEVFVWLTMLAGHNILAKNRLWKFSSKFINLVKKDARARGVSEKKMIEILKGEGKTRVTLDQIEKTFPELMDSLSD